MYFELFTSKQELPMLTNRKNQEFIERIISIQRELRPEAHKLPALYGDNTIKNGAKTKPVKVIEM